MNEELYNRCCSEGIRPGFVAEVGVFYPETSNILGFIRDGAKATLVEPDPLCIVKIREYFGTDGNIKLYPFAIYKEHKEISLFRTHASTFVGELESSPALVNDKYKPREEDKFTVQAVTFDEIDDGTIELISIDTEGCEWHVLRFMKSRPLVISLETHSKKYINPFISEISRWIVQNNYKTWYRNKSDTVFIRNSFLLKRKPGIGEKILKIFHKSQP